VEALPGNCSAGCNLECALGVSSYCWLSPTHPDPLGDQLVSLAAAIKRAEDEKGEINRRGRVSHDGFPSQEAAIFIDFASLHQKDAAGKRTPAEHAAFAEALSTMQLWYVHTRTTVFLTRTLPAGYADLPGYAERGWTTCELSWATLAKASSPHCWELVRDVMGCGTQFPRPPPLPPAAMARLVASRRFTSKKGDLPMVIEINTRTILSTFRDIRDLDYRGLGWGDAEVAQLCEVLPLCRSLRGLNLYGNPIGKRGENAVTALVRDGKLPLIDSILTHHFNVGRWQHPAERTYL